MPTLWSIPTQMVAFLQSMHKPKDIEIQMSFTIRSPIMLARNELIRQAIIGGYDKLIFLDDDNPPDQQDFIQRLLDENKQVITWLIPSRNPDNLWTHRLCIFDEWEKDNWEHFYDQYINLPEDEIFEIKNCGCGCVMIDREVFERVYNRFDWYPCEMRYMRYRKTPNWDISEDSIDFYWINDWLVRYKKYISEDVCLFERIRKLWYSLRATKKVTCRHLADGKRITINEHITKENAWKPILLWSN